jgi:L-lactate dehydrogenase complex protein LldG
VTTAREQILDRIRTALADRPAAATIPRLYRRVGGVADIDLFVERVAHYRATVHRTSGTVADTMTGVLRERGIARIVIADRYPNDWLPSVEVVREPVDIATLDDVSAVISTCRVAVAETGTIVLDAGPGMGRRALTLVPDYHLVIVRADQIVANVPDALAVLDPTRPLTWISGPSATSDIELQRVEGVHGPRTLDVVLV